MAATAHPRSRSRRPNTASPLAQRLIPEVRLARLREALTRQRNLLLADWNLSFLPPDGNTQFPDPADLAANDLDRQLAYHVRTRMITKLKRIERALALLRARHYRYCASVARRFQTGGWPFTRIRASASHALRSSIDEPREIRTGAAIEPWIPWHALTDVASVCPQG